MLLRDFVDFDGVDRGVEGVLNSGRRTQPQVGEVGELAPDIVSITGITRRYDLYRVTNRAVNARTVI